MIYNYRIMCAYIYIYIYQITFNYCQLNTFSQIQAMLIRSSPYVHRHKLQKKLLKKAHCIWINNTLICVYRMSITFIFGKNKTGHPCLFLSPRFVLYIFYMHARRGRYTEVVGLSIPITNGEFILKKYVADQRN
jgi:hypothetical protein